MQLRTNLRLTATTPVAGTPALRPREERDPRPLAGSGGAPALRTRTQSEQAAILHWGSPPVESGQPPEEDKEPGEPASTATAEEDLAHDEQQSLQSLKRRDREVRLHEQTHRSLGGQYAGSIHLDYEVGPDGKRYAVSGTTPIDISPVQGDPVATLRKMEVVQRAATAPANPSGADHQVAAEAAHQAQQARAEMAAQRYEQAHELARSAPTAERGEEQGEDRQPTRAAPPRPAPGSEPAPGSLFALRA